MNKLKNDLNPVEQERRQQKLQAKKKQKSKKRDLNKITVEDIPESNVSNSTSSQEQQKRLGPKSIFYDPEWNPYGEIPSKYLNKYPNLYYNATKSKLQPNAKPVSNIESELLTSIEIPQGDPPRFYKRKDVQVTYQGEEYLQLMPTTLIRKKPKYS